MRRRNGNRQMSGQVNQMGGRQRGQRRNGMCRFEGPGMRMNLESNSRQMANRRQGKGICMNLEDMEDSKEFLVGQKEFLENRINCINEQLENIE